MLKQKTEKKDRDREREKIEKSERQIEISKLNNIDLKRGNIPKKEMVKHKAKA